MLSAVRSLALEAADLPFRVNAVSPGLVSQTPMFDQSTQAFKDDMKAHYPLGFGTPEDVAATVAFLLSADARWITGTEIVIDGGFHCR